MAKAPWYQDEKKLRAQVREHGGITAAANANGTKPNTVQQWASRFGIKSPAAGAKIGAARKLSEPVSREEILATENRELRAIIAQHRKQDVIDEKILDVVREHVTPITPRYEPGPKAERGNPTPHTFMLQWSDLHACEVVDHDAMNGLNAYDWEIMLARHERMRQAIISFKDNRPYPVEELVIAGIGDMLTGDIHDELRVTNEKTLSEATFQLAHDMGDWIESLVPEFPRIRFRGTFGNHGRMTQKPSFKNAFHNWDWLFYKTLELRLSRYPSIDFEASKAAQVPIMIYNKRVLLWHGDGVRSTMVDVPWGGIIRFSKKLADTWAGLGQPIDHLAIGHWHEANMIRAGAILMNGSVKGPDEYSLARFGGGQSAKQLLHTFHPRRGLTETCVLDLQ
jgi:hypothetical protein